MYISAHAKPDQLEKSAYNKNTEPVGPLVHEIDLPLQAPLLWPLLLAASIPTLEAKTLWFEPLRRPSQRYELKMHGKYRPLLLLD